jgi:hypothetical protein
VGLTELIEVRDKRIYMCGLLCLCWLQTANISRCNASIYLPNQEIWMLLFHTWMATIIDPPGHIDTWSLPPSCCGVFDCAPLVIACCHGLENMPHHIIRMTMCRGYCHNLSGQVGHAYEWIPCQQEQPKVLLGRGCICPKPRRSTKTLQRWQQ